MSKYLRNFLIVLLFWCMSAMGQVIADFEDGTNGFGVGWGDALTNVSTIMDTSATNGTNVLALDYDFDIAPAGAMAKAQIDVNGAEVLGYYIYLPADTPDSLLIKVWAQDDSWSWQDMKYYSRDIPKNKWVMLDFNMEAARINSGGDFDQLSAPLQKTGLEIQAYDETDADSAWAGTILVDNVLAIGAEPVMLATFDAGTDGFSFGWGDALTSVAQNADSMALDLVYDFSIATSGAVAKASVDATMGYILGYDIFLPADTPDSLMIKVWAQDDSWSWQDVKIYSRDLAKEKWIPIYFNMEKARHSSGFDFDHTTANLQKIGLEIGAWDETDADASWAGTIMVDNARVLGIETGAKWVMADFDSEAGGTQGFTRNNWGSAMTDFGWKADPTGESDGVLNTVWAFTSGMAGAKEAFQKGGVPFEQENEMMETDTVQMVSLDVWIPASIPDSALQLSIWASPAQSGWSEQKVLLPNSEYPGGTWATFYYDVISRVRSGEHILGQSFTVGAQVYDNSGVLDFTGEIYFDNFTLYGISEPAGELVPPAVIGSKDTVSTTGTFFELVNISWEDLSIGTETYNVYMSESPFATTKSPAVVRIADQIPHGAGSWNHRPFSRYSVEKTFYYAVTAVSAAGEETDITGSNTVGPFEVMTSPTAKAVYDTTFADQFVLDGLNTEFQQFSEYQITPETAGGDDASGWTPDSPDMSFKATFVVDNDYLYISADVTDDDLNSDGSTFLVGGQAWMGDALEFYMGYYDANLLDAWHEYHSVDAGSGDWRISYTAWGTTQSSGTADTDFPGVDNIVYEKFAGDGYIIEARIAIDSLGSMDVVPGAFMPLRIDGTDMDPSFGDSARTLNVQYGGSGGNPEDWLRPSAWAFLEVLDSVNTVISDGDMTPRTYQLHDNYPNPFNPTTNIKFDLPKASEVKVDIYNVIGQKVRTLINEKRKAGTHVVQWNGKNDAGVSLSTGTYFLRFKADNFNKIKKMMLLK